MSARIFALIALGGCYTSSNKVTVEPVTTKQPVSLSDEYVDQTGAIVSPEQYTPVKSFDFKKTVEVPRHEERRTSLDLTPDLSQIVAESDGDAVTNLRIQATDYERGSHRTAAAWKVLGWSFALTGVTFVATAAASGDSEFSSVFYPLGGGFLAAGALSFVFGATANAPTKWTFGISGNVVKRSGSGGAVPRSSDQ